MSIKAFITAIILLLYHASSMATECSATTADKTIPLLELYTSEGCSSCPPADKWISNLKYDKNQVTPLAFHVDYWDYIGWKDKFAKAKYSDRQRTIAAFNGATFVYTPQFTLNGRDFKGWRYQRPNRAIEKAANHASRAQLSLNAKQKQDGSITLNTNAKIINAEDAQHAAVYVVLYENGLVTNVKAGENTGRQLHHDYVVRKLFGAYPIHDLATFNKSFTLHPSWQQKKAGAAIFVQNNVNGEIIQSLALDFCH